MRLDADGRRSTTGRGSAGVSSGCDVSGLLDHAAATAVSATADLRYDFFGPVPEDAAPDGWTYFEFVSRDSHAGWTVEDATAWAQDGRPLAVGRQLRKVLASRAG